MFGDPHRLLDVLGFDQVEAAQDFLGLGERAVECGTAAIADAHGLGRRRVLEHLRLQQPSLFAKLVGVRQTAAHHGVELSVWQRVDQRAVRVDQEHELHSSPLTEQSERAAPAGA